MSEPFQTRFTVDQLDDIARVRAALAARLAEADLPTARIQDVTVAASELMANALPGGHRPVEVTATIDHAAVVIAVTDRRPGWPEIAPADPTRVGGHGLRIVEALTDEWGAHALEDARKQVWFRVDR